MNAAVKFNLEPEIKYYFKHNSLKDRIYLHVYCPERNRYIKDEVSTINISQLEHDFDRMINPSNLSGRFINVGN